MESFTADARPLMTSESQSNFSVPGSASNSPRHGSVDRPTNPIIQTAIDRDSLECSFSSDEADKPAAAPPVGGGVLPAGRRSAGPAMDGSGVTPRPQSGSNPNPNRDNRRSTPGAFAFGSSSPRNIDFTKMFSIETLHDSSSRISGVAAAPAASEGGGGGANGASGGGGAATAAAAPPAPLSGASQQLSSQSMLDLHTLSEDPSPSRSDASPPLVSKAVSKGRPRSICQAPWEILETRPAWNAKPATQADRRPQSSTTNCSSGAANASNRLKPDIMSASISGSITGSAASRPRSSLSASRLSCSMMNLGPDGSSTRRSVATASLAFGSRLTLSPSSTSTSEKGKGTRAQSASIDRSALKSSIKQSVDRLSQPRQPLKAHHDAQENAKKRIEELSAPDQQRSHLPRGMEDKGDKKTAHKRTISEPPKKKTSSSPASAGRTSTPPRRPGSPQVKPAPRPKTSADPKADGGGGGGSGSGGSGGGGNGRQMPSSASKPELSSAARSASAAALPSSSSKPAPSAGASVGKTQKPETKTPSQKTATPAQKSGPTPTAATDVKKPSAKPEAGKTAPSAPPGGAKPATEASTKKAPGAAKADVPKVPPPPSSTTPSTSSSSSKAPAKPDVKTGPKAEKEGKAAATAASTKPDSSAPSKPPAPSTSKPPATTKKSELKSKDDAAPSPSPSPSSSSSSQPKKPSAAATAAPPQPKKPAPSAPPPKKATPTTTTTPGLVVEPPKEKVKDKEKTKEDTTKKAPPTPPTTPEEPSPTEPAGSADKRPSSPSSSEAKIGEKPDDLPVEEGKLGDEEEDDCAAGVVVAGTSPSTLSLPPTAVVSHTPLLAEGSGAAEAAVGAAAPAVAAAEPRVEIENEEEDDLARTRSSEASSASHAASDADAIVSGTTDAENYGDGDDDDEVEKRAAITCGEGEEEGLPLKREVADGPEAAKEKNNFHRDDVLDESPAATAPPESAAAAPKTSDEAKASPAAKPVGVEGSSPETSTADKIDAANDQGKQQQPENQQQQQAKSKKESEAEEAKRKMNEKRKEEREKREKEAEAERLRLEEEKRKEEEEARRIEEAQKKAEEEARKLAEVAKRAEEERLKRAIAEREKREREERARREKEQKEKEEKEKKEKEEEDKAEKERQEKLQKESEEREKRKQRLEEIMRRTRRTDSPTSDQKSDESSTPSEEKQTPSPLTADPASSSPLAAATSAADAASSASPEDAAAPLDSSKPSSAASSARGSPAPRPTTTTATTPADETSGSDFKSPLLQKLPILQKKNGRKESSDVFGPPTSLPLNQAGSPETESPLTSPADEILSPQTAALHGSSPFHDDNDDDTKPTGDAINGNYDVIPSPESAKLVDLEPRGVAPKMNGNLENKSAIADLVFNGGGDPANDNGIDIGIQPKKGVVDPFSSLDGANGNNVVEDVDPFSSPIPPSSTAANDNDAFGPLLDFGLPQPPTLNGGISSSTSPQTDLL